MELLDKLTDPTNVLTETSLDYYKDYNPGDTKQQYQVGLEVKAPKSQTITLETSSAVEQVNKAYTLNVPNPDGKIFSMNINGFQKVFKIGFFNNTSLAYAQLETELRNLLGIDYTVNYTSGTSFSISKYDGSTINYTSPNLVRTITLSNFTEISRIDVVVDGVTVILNGPTYSGDESLAITYLMSQLSTSTYYMDDTGDTLIIARKDGAIPVISKVQYNKYTYSVGFKYDDTPLTGQYHTSTTFGIDGTNYNFTVGDGLNTRVISNGRPFNGDLIIKYFEGKLSEVNTGFNFGTVFNPGISGGTKITIHKNCKITTVGVAGDNTTAYIKNNAGTTLATATVTSGIATFNYDITPGIYRIEATGDSYRSDYATLTKTNELFTAFSVGSYNGSDTPFTGYIHNITSINVEGTILSTSTYNYTFSYSKSSGGFDTVWTSDNRALYFGQNQTLRINKPDYSVMTFVQTSTGDGGMSPSLYTVYSENDNRADITTANYTEITITLTQSSNGYYIPVGFNPVKIEITAEASVGRSEGIYEGGPKRGAQSCNSSISGIVQDRIFQTNASNYGNVISITRAGFYMNWTTNTNNKLLIKCSA